MKYSVAVVLASVAAGVQAQGISSAISPEGAAPSGCVATGSGTYEITVVKPTVQKRSLVARADCGGEGTLVVQLNNGVLTDSKGRIGAIVANRQFQFDGPPAQTGSIYTAGWSICSNSSLAIGPTTDFYQCLSGGFYNLYDQTVGEQCQAVNLNVIACGASSASTTTESVAGVSTQSDGQPTASSAASPVSQQSDGQPTAPPATTVAPISQISDGQIQATAPAVVSQISDGQPQATSATNGTITTGSPAPIATGGASSLVASGAAVVLGAAAMLFL